MCTVLTSPRSEALAEVNPPLSRRAASSSYVPITIPSTCALKVTSTLFILLHHIHHPPTPHHPTYTTCFLPAQATLSSCMLLAVLSVRPVVSPPHPCCPCRSTTSPPRLPSPLQPPLVPSSLFTSSSLSPQGVYLLTPVYLLSRILPSPNFFDLVAIPYIQGLVALGGAQDDVG